MWAPAFHAGSGAPEGSVRVSSTTPSATSRRAAIDRFTSVSVVLLLRRSCERFGVGWVTRVDAGWMRVAVGCWPSGVSVTIILV